MFYFFPFVQFVQQNVLLLSLCPTTSKTLQHGKYSGRYEVNPHEVITPYRLTLASYIEGLLTE